MDPVGEVVDPTAAWQIQWGGGCLLALADLTMSGADGNPAKVGFGGVEAGFVGGESRSSERRWQRAWMGLVGLSMDFPIFCF